METVPSLRITKLPRDGLTEVFLTASAAEGDAPSVVFSRLEKYMRLHTSLRILRQDIFGLPASRDDRAPGTEWPVTSVGQGSPGSPPFAGIHVHAVEGAQVETIRMGGRAVGSVFEDKHARYCQLGDLRAEDLSLPREAQARRVFETMDEALRLCGMDFSDTVRTWLYIDDILAWYRPFNDVRTKFFDERRVLGGLVPASTGIGVSNTAGAALVAALFAVEPKDSHARIEAVRSPLQCPALDYGSSFSRAVEVRTPDLRRVFVSGTASIAPGGGTVHAGDVDAQVDLSMEVVHAILESRGMDWKNVTRAMAYFKDGADATAFDRYGSRNGLPAMPIVFTQSDICRDDLLYEVEVDAVAVG